MKKRQGTTSSQNEEVGVPLMKSATKQLKKYYNAV